MTLSTIKQHKNLISWNIILNELTEPIHDGFDLKDLIQKVERAEADTGLKTQIVNNLKIAHSKLN
jgi:hypothetical protein